MSSPHTLAPTAAVASPLAVLVVDGGARTGFGHVGRCLALWEELGGRAVFAAEDADVVRVLRTLGAPVGAYALGAPVEGYAPGAPVEGNALGAPVEGNALGAPIEGNALGAPIEEYALGAPVGAGNTPPPVAVIDRATPTGAAEVARLQAQGRRVCLLDDPGAGRLRADVVVDPPTGVRWPSAAGRRLAGFEHVLLRRDIRAAAKRGPEGVDVRAAATPPLEGVATGAGASRPLEGVDVLLSLGGSDPEGFTPTLAQALTAAGMAVVSVLGPGYRGPPLPGRVLEDPSQWPCALADAGLLVGRFGHTLLEAAHLGTPALAVAVDERAMTEATAFAAHGTSEAIRVAGPHDAPRVAARALALRSRPARLAAMAARGRELVDGRGAIRVAAALAQLAAGEVRRG